MPCVEVSVLFVVLLPVTDRRRQFRRGPFSMATAPAKALSAYRTSGKNTLVPSVYRCQSVARVVSLVSEKNEENTETLENAVDTISGKVKSASGLRNGTPEVRGVKEQEFVSKIQPFGHIQSRSANAARSCVTGVVRTNLPNGMT